MEDSDLNCVILRDLHLSSESPINLVNEEAVGEVLDNVATAEARQIVEKRERLRVRQREYEKTYQAKKKRDKVALRRDLVHQMERACVLKHERVASVAQSFIAGDMTCRALALALREECAQAALAYKDTRERASVQKWPRALIMRIQQAIQHMRDFQRRLDALER